MSVSVQAGIGLQKLTNIYEQARESSRLTLTPIAPDDDDDGQGEIAKKIKQEDDQGEIAEKRNQEDGQGKIAGKGRQEEDQAGRLVLLGISSRRRARDHPQALSVTRTLHIRSCLQVMEAGNIACPISSGRYDYPLGRGADGREPEGRGRASLLFYPSARSKKICLYNPFSGAIICPWRVAQRPQSHIMRPQAPSLLLPSRPRLCHGKGHVYVRWVHQTARPTAWLTTHGEFYSDVASHDGAIFLVTIPRCQLVRVYLAADPPRERLVVLDGAPAHSRPPPSLLAVSHVLGFMGQ